MSYSANIDRCRWISRGVVAGPLRDASPHRFDSPRQPPPKSAVEGGAMRLSRYRLFAAAVIPAAALATGIGLVAVTTSAAAAPGCRVTYSVSSQWPGGFTGNVNLTNLGDPLTSWTLTWSFSGGQQVTQAWGATVSQSGSQVTARNASWNGNLGTNVTT
ncbi:cellulose binding domain-containing protein, partial [Micromonospora sp. NPDC049891]|uniref:cellulose binding domain-containing protein n=1 Tax=Micromonospora sp. NPDC049891 TaxID=3155655 RepID=UPI003410E958